MRVGEVGVPGSTDAEMKKTAEKLPVLPEKQMKNPTKPPTGEGEAKVGTGAQEAERRGDAPGEQAVSPPRSSKGAV